MAATQTHFLKYFKRCNVTQKSLDTTTGTHKKSLLLWLRGKFKWNEKHKKESVFPLCYIKTLDILQTFRLFFIYNLWFLLIYLVNTLFLLSSNFIFNNQFYTLWQCDFIGGSIDLVGNWFLMYRFVSFITM